jgi:hypothetical protein
MILIFKRGSKFQGTIGSSDIDKEGNVFPLISLPVNAEGSPTDLNDFQWWAYTDKWNEWLKKNPREWQAESKETSYEQAEKIWEDIFSQPDPYRRFFNFQVDSLIEKGKLSSFSDFVKIYEAEEGSSSAVSKKFIKLGYAIESLAKNGTLKNELELDSLQPAEKYAVVVDFFDEEGKPISESRQALRFTKLVDTQKFTLASVDYSIPVGEIQDADSLLKKVGEYAKVVLLSAVALGSLILVGKAAIGLAGTWMAAKTARGIYGSLTQAKTVADVAKPGIWSKLSGFVGRAFGGGSSASTVANAARTVLPSGAYVEGGIAYNAAGTALRGAASKSVQAAATRAVAAGTAEAAGASGLVAAEASNPIGWIIAAVSAVGSIGQQTYNWLSSKQAPRFGEVEDFANGTFKPGDIPIGKPITICWTSDGGAGFWGGVLKVISFSKDDTRTTMDLVKIGSYSGRSLFILLDVHSKSMEAAIKENDLILLAFDNDDSFERGYLDNDDLEFETIAIKNMQEFSIGTSFVGYCGWEEMQEAYNEAPDSVFEIPTEAPSQYDFNYSNNKGERINVSGNLASREELEALKIEEILPMSLEGPVKESFYYNQDSWKSLLERKEVLNFSDFSNLLEAEEKEKEKEKTGEEIKDEEIDSWVKEYSEDNIKAKAEEVRQKEEESKYGQIQLAVYKTNQIEFVDPTSKGQTPDFPYFIVGNESLEATENQPITVEATSPDPINSPRFGLATYTPPAAEPEEEEDQDTQEIEVEKPEQVEVTASEDDINIKDKNRRLVITDVESESEEDVNIASEFLTDEDRKQLGIKDWDNLTKITVRYDAAKNPVKVTLRNKFGGSDKVRRIRRGQAGFDQAIDLANRIKNGVKFK